MQIDPDLTRVKASVENVTLRSPRHHPRNDRGNHMRIMLSRRSLQSVLSVMAGDSGADWTTAASPNALESVIGSGLTAMTRVVGVTRVRSSTIQVWSSVPSRNLPVPERAAAPIPFDVSRAVP
jgi:hypothetical protein